ncbi:hypothetical protein BDM02DRAFT_3129790 [Thelephora ganbajun]|uniref:Uncharacterized protein n=1 Tax=Thelephora ganbajun TaxID=370292 RepID=A0ACB6ZCS2_THEGA|nr:hypothetical protein BDM02DRAFT_3129790 [Thelephora ganbajun]
MAWVEDLKGPGEVLSTTGYHLLAILRMGGRKGRPSIIVVVRTSPPWQPPDWGYPTAPRSYQGEEEPHKSIQASPSWTKCTPLIDITEVVLSESETAFAGMMLVIFFVRLRAPIEAQIAVVVTRIEFEGASAEGEPIINADCGMSKFGGGIGKG